MRVWIGGLALLASCYSPTALPGSPCTPTIANCPETQTCALIAGTYVCVTGPVADAAVDGNPVIDAPPDTAIDAVAVTPWTLVQTAESTTGLVTVAPTHTGDLVIVAVETSSTTAAQIVGDNAANMYAVVPNSRATTTVADRRVELFAKANVTGGATTVAVSAATLYAVVVWEVANAGALDTTATIDNEGASTLPHGAAITTTAAGGFVVSVAIVDNTISGLHTPSPFTNDALTNGNGFAHLTDPQAPVGTYQARWDQGTAGASCATSAAWLVGP